MYVFHMYVSSPSSLSLPDGEFLTNWRKILPSNEVKGSVDNVSLTAGAFSCSSTTEVLFILV